MASPILYTVSSPSANFGRVASKDDTMVLVVARDLFIGCHSFEDYLSPNFETLFVFDKRYADMWDMEHMVLNASSSVSLGAHLAVANGTIGEQSARKMSLNFMRKFDIPPQLIFSVNCDIHPIPKDHRDYQSFETITNKLSTAFRQQKEIRANGQGAYVQSGNITKEYNEIYAMNMLLFERFGGLETLRDAFWHGKDPWAWWRRTHEKGKPQEFVATDQAWVTPVNKFVESHAVMYDREKMEILGNDMFITDCIPSETHAVGQFAWQHGWTVLRNNEVYVHFDQVKGAHYLDMPHYTSKLNKTEMEYMKLLNWELVAKRRNPKLGCEIARTFETKGIRMDAFFGTGFTKYVWRNHWAVSSIQNIPAGSDWAQRWVKAGMSVAGWRQTEQLADGLTTFHAEGCFPSTVALVADSSDKVTEGHVFLKFNTNGHILNVVSWHPFDHIIIGQDYPKAKQVIRWEPTHPSLSVCDVQKRNPIQSNPMPPMQHTKNQLFLFVVCVALCCVVLCRVCTTMIRVPLSNSTVAVRLSTPLANKYGWTNFHIHGEDCTDRNNTFMS